MDLCGTPMIHKDKSVSPCVLWKNHYVDIEDSDHKDEHGHTASVLVHQSTIREVQAVQRWRDEDPESEWNEYEQLICPFCYKLAHPEPCTEEKQQQ